MLSGQPKQTGMTRRGFLLRYTGNAMLAVGGSLFGAAAAYEIYAHRAEAGLSRLNRGSYTLPGATTANQAQAMAPTVTAATAATEQPAAASAGTAAAPAAPPAPSGEEPSQRATAVAVRAPGVTDGMLPVRLHIPSIGLRDARVVEVGTKMENGQLVWATADHAVGHLVGSAIPGGNGNMVLSGHISSPVKGEGNIFHNLPSLADYLHTRVSVQNRDGTWFIYEIVGTRVVLPTDTSVLDPTPAAALTLLTCVPDGVYSHRFVALGRYVGPG